MAKSPEEFYWQRYIENKESPQKGPDKQHWQTKDAANKLAEWSVTKLNWLMNTKQYKEDFVSKVKEWKIVVEDWSLEQKVAESWDKPLPYEWKHWTIYMFHWQEYKSEKDAMEAQRKWWETTEQTQETAKAKETKWQFDGIEIDWKKLTKESYAKMTAKQFSELPRDKAFQLMQVGDKRLSPEDLKPGAKMKINFPNKDTYLHITASMFPENVWSIKMWWKEYERNDNWEFFYYSPDGKTSERLVIWNKDLSEQELEIWSTRTKEEIKTMHEKFWLRNDYLGKKLWIELKWSKWEVLKQSIERGLTDKQVSIMLSQDIDAYKKLPKEEQLQIHKNEMYLEKQWLIKRTESDWAKAKTFDSLVKDFKDSDYAKVKEEDGKKYIEVQKDAEKSSEVLWTSELKELSVKREVEKDGKKQTIEIPVKKWILWNYVYTETVWGHSKWEVFKPRKWDKITEKPKKTEAPKKAPSSK